MTGTGTDGAAGPGTDGGPGRGTGAGTDGGAAPGTPSGAVPGTAGDPAATALAVELARSRTLWELVDRRAALTPDAPVLVEAAEDPADDRSLTFGALRDRSEEVAAGLYAKGVRPGTVVAWQLPTRIETVLLSVALARLGAVQSPVIPFYRDREVGFALRESKAEFFAVPGVWRGFDHTAMAERLGARGIFEAYDSLPAGDPSTLPPPPVSGTDVRWIYWTSGTTSDPKGVLHTDRSLMAGGSCLAHALHLTPADVGSMAFPFAHIAGPDYTVMLLLYGFPAVLFEKFAMPAALDGYRRHGVTVAGGSTAFYSMFLTEQRKRPDRRLIPTLRLLAGGGAPKPPEIYHAVVRELGCQLTHGYGMTEVPMITMGSPDDTPDRLATTEGRPRRRCRSASPHPTGHRAPRTRTAKCGCAERPSARATWTATSRPPPSTPTATSSPATWATSPRTGTSCSPDAARTSSSARARTSPRRR